MKCPECGYNNRSGSRSCRSCNTPLPRPPAAASKRPPQKRPVHQNDTIVSARHGVVRLRKDVADFRRAGFGIRCLAMAIDILFVVMLDGALLFGGGVLIGKTTGIVDMILTSRGLEFLHLVTPLLKAALATTVCVPPLYFIIMTAVFGQTIGKMITGIRVVRSNGGRVSLPRAFVRLVGYVVSGVLLFAGFLWILWDPECQGWHDMLADTIVIRL
jgi:uncharacterized RDD family membrane protein YckC